MVKIKPFEVEQWMDAYETTAKYNIAETCSASISISELKEISDDKNTEPIDFSTILSYGEIRGSTALRSNLARLYSVKTNAPLPADNILVTPGAIMANTLLFYALVGPGDHVICHYPTYQQLYDVPASLGAEVTLWKANEEKGWALDIEELKAMIKPNTKLIILNNPNNPTGALIPKTQLESIIEIAKQHNNIPILSDEVYRPVFHSITPLDPEFPPSLLSMGYPNALTTGSLSKAYSLAGIRIGWIASRSQTLISKIAAARDYTTISVSQLDDQVATFALSQNTIHPLLARNIQLARTNVQILEKFIAQHSWACEWTKPKAGTVAFVKFSKMGDPVDDVEFCRRLHEETGVMFCPGSKCFGDGKEFQGYVRMGFACKTEVLEEGLEKLKLWLKGSYKEIPLAASSSASQ
ncbi:MAG: hypothetical protein M1834_003664 [Cirrosporium novae-zelandiae]|nr:MAG: hypothetical protein M1834_003664 [Cirrosporium novae-zelandiae]